jgi:hypothetical protein
VPQEQKKIMHERYQESQHMLPRHLRQDQYQEQIQGKDRGKSAPKGPYPGVPRPAPGQKPLVDLQVYTPPKPPAPRRTVDPALFVPMHTTTPHYPPQYQYMHGQGLVPGYQHPFLYKPNEIPVIKNYTINVGGPEDDHAKVSAIYEDILPSKEFVNTSNTLGERLNIYNFVRSIFIRQSDGEDINLGNGQNSLLSYLKLMDLNPYSSHHFTENPYKSLPDNMLIYRSCYPIRFDRHTHTVQCASNSIGMNIRIYKLTMAEYNIKKQDSTKYHEHDIWREVAYYEYIREQVIKRKVCPNFAMLFAYYICENCNIDFDKLAKIKGNYKKEPDYIVDGHKAIADVTGDIVVGYDDDANASQYKPLKIDGPNGPKDTQQKAPSQDEYKEERNAYGIPKRISKEPVQTIMPHSNAFSGRALIALTESPNYNIYGWASRTYQVDGNIRKMVNTGFHTSEVWQSVLFQIIVALYVLQIHKIAFRDFTIKDNIYIKDISAHSNITNYWKYKIDGIDYYIPNYGYLVLVDSNFKDVEKKDYTFGKKSSDKKYKIYSNIYKRDDGKEWDDQDLIKKCCSKFKNVLDPNAFSKSFTNEGGSKPPEDILDLITKIHDEATSSNKTDIGHYIYTYMRMFMNNRVGTLLKETEVKNVRKDDHKPLSKGDVVVHEVQHETYKFVIYVNGDSQQGKATILTREDQSKKDIIEKEVPITSLFNYSRYDPIVQNYKANEANLNDEDLLEVYEINCR